MAQVFHKSMNPVGKTVVLGLPVFLGGVGIFLAIFYRSSYATGAYEVVQQPVPFSHAHHVGDLGIDCRYCHTGVENSSFAGIPPTKTCMNCHQQMWTGSDMLYPVRQSYETGNSIPWVRVTNLPDYAYFNHSIHVNKGVGCVECHGQIDEMNLTFQTKTLLMEWCLKCHRAPETSLRPREDVTSMTWTLAEAGTNPETGEPYHSREELGAQLKEKYHVRDASILTNCSICHR